VTEGWRTQKRSRRIAMTPSERDAFLEEQRVCRVATLSADGPHVAPLWYAWVDSRLWLYSISHSQRWTDLDRDPRCAVVVDAGEADYGQLRGVELRCRAEPVGEVPRIGKPNPRLEPVEQEFARRYTGGVMHYDGKHAWLRLVPYREYSWDFRKLFA
jgi:Pyridoxamine 5'-phosphate oxidase